MEINQSDYQSLLDCLDVAVIVLAGDLKESPEIIYNNDAFAHWVSASQEEILGQSLAFLFSPDDRSALTQALGKASDEGGDQIVSMNFEGLDQQHRKIDFVVKPFKKQAGKVVSCVAQEIKPVAKVQVDNFQQEPGSMAWKLAQKDEETGVFHRRYLYEQVERECLRLYRYGSIYTLIGVELIIEDEGNSDVSSWDEAFHSAAKLLDDAFRSQDVIGRHQPDQFVVLMPETKLSQALYVAERLKKDFNDKVAESGVRVAIGVTEGKVTDEHFSDALARVDASIEEARASQGRKVACST